jgi:hypothetical protein
MVQSEFGYGGCVEIWTQNDVKLWLKQINYEAYANAFRQHSINGQALIMLSEDDLKDIIDKIGDRKNISFYISQLKSRDYRDSSDVYVDMNNNATVVCGSCLLNSDSIKHVNEKARNGEKRKTLVSAVYCFSIALWTAFIVTVVHDRVPNMQKYPPLPDIFLGRQIDFSTFFCKISAKFFLQTPFRLYHQQSISPKLSSYLCQS